jgi:TrfA protein
MMEKAVSGSAKSIQELHQRTLEIIECERKKEEERLVTGVIYLPTWREDRRGSPNSFLRSALFAAIQGKDRADFKKVEIFSQQGITITYTGEQLNQEDLTVWLALVDLMKKDPLGTECKFTAHEILKYMGLPTGGTQYEQLEMSVQRMTACLVRIETERYIYGRSLIEGFDIDKNTNKYRVQLSRDLIKLFGDNDWTAMNWEQRKQLKNKPLCLKLHDYYSSHEKPLPVSLGFLSNITGSVNKQKAGFKAKVKIALEELIKVGFLRSYSIEGDMLNVERDRNSTNQPKSLLINK